MMGWLRALLRPSFAAKPWPPAATSDTDLVERWRRREPGLIRCQDCLTVMVHSTNAMLAHQCPNPQPHIAVLFDDERRP